jgi:dihydropteroate synthase
MAGTIWKIAGQTIDLSERAMIMGVLNVTPDSFSDGGEFLTAEKAVEQGRAMAAQGAQIIDVGGESTRPGAEAVSAEEELARVIPVIRRLDGSVSAFISIDTSKAVVARAALNAGASIINDVTGGRADPEMMALAAESRAAFIIMHMQGTPRSMQAAPHYDDVVAEVTNFFRQQYDRALGLIPWPSRLIRASDLGKRWSTICRFSPISRVSGFTIGRSSSASRASRPSVK